MNKCGSIVLLDFQWYSKAAVFKSAMSWHKKKAHRAMEQNSKAASLQPTNFAELLKIPLGK